MKPICVKCKLFFTCKITGIAFEEGMPTNVLNENRIEWQSYKLWMGDLWECRGCGSQIIAGIGHHPVAEHYQENYGKRVSELQPMLRVDDC